MSDSIDNLNVNMRSDEINYKSELPNDFIFAPWEKCDEIMRLRILNLIYYSVICTDMTIEMQLAGLTIES